MVTKTRDRDTLLQQACDLLTRKRGYLHVLIAAYDGDAQDGGRLHRLYSAGMAEGFRKTCAEMPDALSCPCMRKAIEAVETVMIVKPHAICASCPVAGFYDTPAAQNGAGSRGDGAFSCDGSVLAAPLSCDGKLYGILHALLPPEMQMDGEDKEIFAEVAGDIAFALRAMELREAELKARDSLRRELEQKNLLLKEVHHRVKNNLMMMESLLHLQCRHTKSEEFIHSAGELSGRIYALARLHERLYRSETFMMVDFEEYAESIVRDLFCGNNAGGIKIEKNIEKSELGIDKAIPLGIILNELLTNAAKYAFPGGEGGKVFIGFKRDGSNYILSVRDTGVGLPRDFDFDHAETLGLMLVKVLTEQMGGTVNIENNSNGGAAFRLEFPA